MDESRNRLRRLRDILDVYMPRSYVDDGRVRIVHGSGASFVNDEEARGNSYDRVGSRCCSVVFCVPTLLPVQYMASQCSDCLSDKKKEYWNCSVLYYVLYALLL